jgi:hypothetical protein
MKLVTALIAAIGLFASGCATNPVDPVELEALPDFAVTYTGEVGAGLKTELPEVASVETDSDLAYLLMMRIVKGTPEAAAAQFGEKVRSIGVWSVPADEVTRERLSALETVSAPAQIVREGKFGRVQIGQHTSFISKFEVSGDGASRVADPVVDTVVTGLSIGMRAQSVTETSMRLSLDMQIIDLVVPIRKQEVTVFGAPMTVETPVLSVQRMTGEGVVAEDRVLVLTGWVFDGEVYVVLLTASRVQLDENGNPPRPK